MKLFLYFTPTSAAVLNAVRTKETNAVRLLLCSNDV